MTTVFADTFFFLAILNARDAAHHGSIVASRATRARWVTTAWVLTEVADAMALPGNRAVFLKFLRTLESNSNVTINPASDALYRRGLEFYASRPDKEWSLTDCISFVVMLDHGITEALTGDHHFTQAGFVALLS
ncbi:MAG: type II toxin-antitoxin system VapC family toxin [Opitutaceae bacterium]